MPSTTEFHVRMPAGIGLPPVPPCFGAREWKGWLEFGWMPYQAKGEQVICEDCTVAYQSEMKGLGLCKYPDSKVAKR